VSSAIIKTTLDMVVGEGCTLSGNSASGNRAEGIDTREGSKIANNSTYQNGGWGIYVLSGSRVTGNTSHLNGNGGIRAGAGCAVSNNSAYKNDELGIRGGTGGHRFTSQPFENNADLLFRGELPSGSAADLAHRCFARLLLLVRHFDTLLGVTDPGMCLLD